MKLLRVLQQREIIPVGGTEAVPIDTRLIAATNRDLEEEMKRGGFRSDLYYRLNVFALHLPPLRQRREDIPLLVDHVPRSRGAEQRGEPVKRVSPRRSEVMMEYEWPGNVRELENALERAAILSKGDVIDVPELPERVTERRSEPLITERTPTSNPRSRSSSARTSCGCCRRRAATRVAPRSVLGIDPSTLYRKLSRYGVEV